LSEKRGLLIQCDRTIGCHPRRSISKGSTMHAIRIATALATGAALAGSATAQQQAPENLDNAVTVYTGRDAGPARDEAAAARLLQRARERGSVRVIVGLTMTLRDEDALPPAQAARQARTLRATQNAVAERVLGGRSSAGVTRFSSIPFMSMVVDASQLTRLLADPDIASIQEDRPAAPNVR
jgi:hypothetical protein